MARSGVRDPLDKFRWTVSIDGFSKLGFLTCGTPEYKINAKEYPEGGNHLNPRRIVDSISYQPITLSRGATNDTSFNKWATGFIDAVQDNAGINNTSSDDLVSKAASNGASAVANSSTTTVDGTPNYRKNIKIEHVNRAGQVEVAYYLYNAFPIAYKPASDFDAATDDGVSIESITLGYEGFEVKYTGVSGFVGNLLAKKLL